MKMFDSDRRASKVPRIAETASRPFESRQTVRTKIVATIGPACREEESLRGLVEAGVARFAHPDVAYEVEARGFAPWQEPLLGQEWHMDTTGTLTAWRLAEARNLVPQASVVALLDLGFEAGHHDLVDAWLQNGGEVPANKKDDDGNGLIDWQYAQRSGKAGEYAVEIEVIR